MNVFIKSLSFILILTGIFSCNDSGIRHEGIHANYCNEPDVVEEITLIKRMRAKAYIACLESSYKKVKLIKDSVNCTVRVNRNNRFRKCYNGTNLYEMFCDGTFICEEKTK